MNTVLVFVSKYQFGKYRQSRGEEKRWYKSQFCASSARNKSWCSTLGKGHKLNSDISLTSTVMPSCEKASCFSSWQVNRFFFFFFFFFFNAIGQCGSRNRK